jgi:hypothetical protein
MRIRLVDTQPCARRAARALLTASREAPIHPASSSWDNGSAIRIPSGVGRPHRSASSTNRAATRPAVSCAPNSIRLRSASRSRAARTLIMALATFGSCTAEVSADAGATWSDAELEAVISDFAWRFWHWSWTPRSAARHTLTVRATDGTGALQTKDDFSITPAGAAAWHSISIFGVE